MLELASFWFVSEEKIGDDVRMSCTKTVITWIKNFDVEAEADELQSGLTFFQIHYKIPSKWFSLVRWHPLLMPHAS